MAGRGNQIIVTSDPKGRFDFGKLYGAIKPGTCVQIRAAAGLDGDGRPTFEPYAPGTDGEQREVIVVLENQLLGGLMTTAYADGDVAQVYYPEAGDELNVLKGDVSGTGDDFAFGDMLMIDSGTGKVIKATGSPEMESFRCLEAVVDPTTDVLVHAQYTGH